VPRNDRSDACAVCFVNIVSHLGLAVVFFWTITADTRAEQATDLQFLKPVILAAARLQLRIMSDAVEVPPPPPRVFTYEMWNNTSTSRVEMYSPMELWRRSQYAAQWTDAAGNRLLVATIKRPPPTEFSRPHVTMEQYEAAAARNDEWSRKLTPSDLAAWATAFLGSGPLQAIPHDHPPPRLADLMVFQGLTLPCQFAYAFRLRPTPRVGASASECWFFALVETGPGVDPQKAARAIQRQFLPYLAQPTAIFSPNSPFKPREVGAGSPSPPTALSPEFAASRQLVTESIANLKDWWAAEAEHYILLSNLGREHAAFVRELQRDLGTLRHAFERLLPPQAPIRAVSVIRVFRSPAEYAAYVGADSSWTFGLWMPQRKELVVRPLATGDRDTDRAHLLRGIYHEAFHQYLFYALDQRESSPWFNEGHATFFENAEVKDNRVYIHEDETKVRLLQQMIAAGRIDLSKMLAMPLEAFYAGNDQARAEHYALAWGLIYYLRQCPPPHKPASYEPVLDRYYESLYDGENPTTATVKAFSGINLHDFTTNFSSFWQSDTKRSAARKNRLVYQKP